MPEMFVGVEGKFKVFLHGFCEFSKLLHPLSVSVERKKEKRKKRKFKELSRSQTSAVALSIPIVGNSSFGSNIEEELGTNGLVLLGHPLAILPLVLVFLRDLHKVLEDIRPPDDWVPGQAIDVPLKVPLPLLHKSLVRAAHEHLLGEIRQRDKGELLK